MGTPNLWCWFGGLWDLGIYQKYNYVAQFICDTKILSERKIQYANIRIAYSITTLILVYY